TPSQHASVTSVVVIGQPRMSAFNWVHHSDLAPPPIARSSSMRQPAPLKMSRFNRISNATPSNKARKSSPRLVLSRNPAIAPGVLTSKWGLPDGFQYGTTCKEGGPGVPVL